MKTFDKFTHQYSLSKTLRFELKPVGKTLENMKKNLEYDKNLQTFLKDQNIEDAYQFLKPLIDDIHEEFITNSLESDRAKEIDFSIYLEAYKNREDNKKEKELRKEINNLYGAGEKRIKANYQHGWKWNKKEQRLDKKADLRWKVQSKEKKGPEILKSPDILSAAISKANVGEEDAKKHLKAFEGFYTYFSGFNDNRANYYEVKEEKATAIATRIVHENLPRFCDNHQQFFGFIKKLKNNKEVKFFRKKEYLDVYDYLKSQNKDTKIKDAESGKMIEAYAITEKIFDIAHFSQCLSQAQIEEYNKIIGHYNLLINLYNQARRGEKDFKKLPHFKTLYKQIGCGKRNELFFSLKYDFEKDLRDEDKDKVNEILSVEKTLKEAYKLGEKYFKVNQKNKNEESVKTIFDFTRWLKSQEQWDGFYWSKQAVNTISNKYFVNWYDIKERLKSDKTCVSFDKKREEQIKVNDAVELSGLFAVLDQVNQDEDWTKTFFRESILKERQKTIDVQKKPSENLINLLCEDIEKNAQDFIDKAEGNFSPEEEGEDQCCLESALEIKDYHEEENKKCIKEWMDHALAVNRMIKYFSVKENKVKGNAVDAELSNNIDYFLRGDGENWFKWYDALRNYLTKKPQDDAKENKLKLNFENSTLAEGWDLNKESENSCVILKDNEDRKYLAVMQKGDKKIFEKKWVEGRGKNKKVISNPIFDENGKWLKMEYKQIAAPSGIGGFVRKCFGTAKQYGWVCPKNCLNGEGKIIIRNDEAEKAGLADVIDCHKDFFDKYEKDGFKYRDYNFHFKPSGDYANLKEFFDDVENQGYKMSFVRLSQTELDKLVEAGRLYLFEIKNQDNNNGKKMDHKQNLHTIYWNSVFSDDAGKPKLNGKAELFYRRAIPKNKRVFVKDQNGNEIKNRNGEKVIRNFRFSKEKFLFHCSIMLNYKDKSYQKPKYAFTEVNNCTNSAFENQDVYFLGLDRGEKHLVYYSLVDQNGNIVPGGQGSFNKINDQDYHKKLDEKEGKRQEARKNWQTIGNIKNLKEGYISQVVHEIVKKITDQPTFIVLEDLNTGFKRSRQKIEKQVYQKFELALAKKLNFVVDKGVKSGEIGSVENALQLTPPVNNYQDIAGKKQFGIMLYTRANYTSQTDPVTGWRKTIYPKRGSEQEIKKQILENFTDIGFDGKDYFFSYEHLGKTWKLWSGKDGKSLLRYRGKREKDKNEWIVKSFDLNERLNGIFVGFDLHKSLKAQILDEGKEISKICDKNTAWESLRLTIDLIQQIRNSGDVNEKQDDNFLQSPVRNENGEHFDSRLVTESEGLPIDADANGAYNIARKGIIMNEHIKQWKKDGSQKSDLDLFISDLEWDLWLSDRKKWQEMLPIFASRSKMIDFRKNKTDSLGV